MSKGINVIEPKQRDQVGEGPLWVEEEQALYWVDILGQRLNRLAYGDGSVDGWDMPQPIGWIIKRKDHPGFIAGLKSGFAWLELNPLRVRPFGSPEPDCPDNRLNDAKADSHGCIWAGTMSMEGGSSEGGFYRLDTDGAVSCVDAGYRIPNGPAISIDGQWLYHADSALGLVYRYALRGARLEHREVFVRFDEDWGLPDGMTVDADNCLWVAHWGGGCVSRFTPEGVRERWIDLPASQITSCAFGGSNFDRMFVTSAALGLDGKYDGALFEVDPGCRGMPAGRYGG